MMIPFYISFDEGKPDDEQFVTVNMDYQAADKLCQLLDKPLRKKFGDDFVEAWLIGFRISEYLDLETARDFSVDEFNFAVELVLNCCQENEELKQYLEPLRAAFKQDMRYQKAKNKVLAF